MASVARARWRALFTDATARVEELGDLLGLPAEHLAQDQDRPLPRRQVLERGDERESDRLAGDGDVGRIAAGRDGAVVRYGLDPGRLGQRRRRAAASAVSGRVEVDRPGPSLARALHVEADVRRDLVQPRAEGRPALERVVAAPRPDERLLDRVLRLERRAQDPVAVAGQLDPVRLEARASRSAVGLAARAGRDGRWWLRSSTHPTRSRAGVAARRFRR